MKLKQVGKGFRQMCYIALNVSCDYILNDSNQQTVPDFIIELVKKLDSKEQVAVEHILEEIIRLREE